MLKKINDKNFFLNRSFTNQATRGDVVMVGISYNVLIFLAVTIVVIFTVLLLYLNSQFNSAQTSIHELQTQSNALNAIVNSLSNKNQQLMELLAEINHENSFLENLILDIRKENDKWLTTIESLEETLSVMKSRLTIIPNFITGTDPGLWKFGLGGYYSWGSRIRWLFRNKFYSYKVR